MTKKFIQKKFQILILMAVPLISAMSCNNEKDGDDAEEPVVSVVSTLVAPINSNDALSVDASGNIYASNFGEYGATGGNGTSVLKITPTGVVTTFIDGLSGPLGNFIDASGNVYVISGNNGTTGNVVKVLADGTKSTLATLSGWPAGITMDAGGNLYISNYSESKIHKITSSGALSVFADDARLAGCVGIDIDDQGNILLGNYNDGKIYSVNASGVVTLITQIENLESGFSIGYIAYYDGAIYATAIGNNKVYKVGLNGSKQVFAGSGSNASTDGPLLTASFKNPNGIAIDKINKIMYIQDWGQQSLRKIVLE